MLTPTSFYSRTRRVRPVPERLVPERLVPERLVPEHLVFGARCLGTGPNALHPRAVGASGVRHAYLR